MTRSRPLALFTLALLAALALLAGCSKDSDKKSATQVAARVNKDEISVHQINQALQRTPNVPPGQIKQASRQVLDRLIDQELFVQQALENKLDRDPQVMQTLEAARREVLARAWAARVTSKADKPPADEVRKFYAEHPELFAQRRVFNVQELAIRATPEQIAALKEKMGKSNSLGDVTQWLREQKIQFTGNAGLRAAEQLPMELLPRYQAMKDGQTALITGASGAIVVHLAASRADPRDEKTATPFIEQYLMNRERAKLTADELKSLRAKATIEYMGDFGPPEGAGAATPAAAAPAAVAAPEAAPGPGLGGDTSHIDKGLSGLK